MTFLLRRMIGCGCTESPETRWLDSGELVNDEVNYSAACPHNPTLQFRRSNRSRDILKSLKPSPNFPAVSVRLFNSSTGMAYLKTRQRRSSGVPQTHSE